MVELNTLVNITAKWISFGMGLLQIHFLTHFPSLTNTEHIPFLVCIRIKIAMWCFGNISFIKLQVEEIRR